MQGKCKSHWKENLLTQKTQKRNKNKQSQQKHLSLPSYRAPLLALGKKRRRFWNSFGDRFHKALAKSSGYIKGSCLTSMQDLLGFHILTGVVEIIAPNLFPKVLMMVWQSRSILPLWRPAPPVLLILPTRSDFGICPPKDLHQPTADEAVSCALASARRQLVDQGNEPIETQLITQKTKRKNTNWAM